ncbi:MAG: M56 family metallopeptidase [Bryobacteraceae bacterium]
MTSELTNHIWQSTIFAVAAGLMTIGFRKNRAHVRYSLWLSASLKFLLPFSLLIALGNRLEWRPAAHSIAATSTVTLSMIEISQPFPETLPLAPSMPHARDWAVIAIFSVWVFGFAAVALIRFRGWRRIRAAVRSSTPMNALGAMQVRSSPGLLEPGVVGFFRPILLLPPDIGERLEPRQLEAVLAHELCHVRRRDNLTSAIHMLVEAIFWFHPLVWWIGARLVEERERACDEAVLSLGNQPQDYAEGILKVCKSYLESPLSCVAGVTGSNLKKRIHAILTGRAACELNFAKKLALAGAGIAALGLPILVGIVSTPAVRAQSPLAAPKFEAVSIKACAAFRKSHYLDLPAGTFHSECTTVEHLIQQAYGLFGNGHMNPGSFLGVAGGPAWTRSELYEIDGKAKGPQSRAMMNGPMLEALLEDRFKLRVHRETRDVPVYALTVAAGGPKLQPFQGSCIPRDFDKPPSEADCGTARFRGNGFEMKAATMADLCTGFSVLLDRRVVDETGIAGRFTVQFDLSADDRGLLNRSRSLPALSDPTVPSPPPVLFESVKTEMRKLGLKLAPAMRPGEFIVIDRVERPSGI